MCRWVISVPLQKFEQISAPRMTAAMTDDLNAVSMAVGGVPTIFINAVAVLSCLIYVGVLSWFVLCVYLGVLAAGFGLSVLVRRRAMSLLHAGMMVRRRFFGHLEGLFLGAKQLRVHRNRRRDFFHETLAPEAAHVRTAFTRMLAGETTASSVFSASNWVLIAIVLFVLPRAGITDAHDGAAQIIILMYVTGYLGGIIASLNHANRGAVALASIEELGLSLGEPDPLPITHEPDPPPFERALELVGVTHGYRQTGNDERAFMLGPIDLTIHPGEVVFFVGGNGSGKTTLAKVLLGLYEPDSGAILLDGHEVTAETRESYRQHFSPIFLDFYLFETIQGIAGHDLDERANKLLARLRIEHKVKVDQGRLSTVDLSQGQRKRLALVSAYLEDRSIYVFDEWAADQDPEFKQLFYEELLPELRRRGKACLVISHDDRYFHTADRVITLEEGKILSQSRGRSATG